jgi:hypothetical protein
VLILENNFDGGHGAFPCYNAELTNGFKQNNIKFFVAKSVEEAITIYTNNDISFSINIGVYDYYLMGQPLYDVYKIVNYEWIIDNPRRYVKYNIDFVSEYNRLIYIDKDFFKINSRDDYVWQSLGGPNNDFSSSEARIEGIFVPMDIRGTPESILDKTTDIKTREHVVEFVASFDYDQSFVDQSLSFVRNKGITDYDEFILIANAYIRLKKRIDLISSIKRHNIYIASDYINPCLKNKNIHYLPEGNFNKSLELQRKHKYVLNCTPNYEYCLHERITYAACNGAVVISDENSFLGELNFPGIIQYSRLAEIDDFIDELDKDYELVRETQKRIVDSFKMKNAIKNIVKHYLRGVGNEL